MLTSGLECMRKNMASYSSEMMFQAQVLTHAYVTQALFRSDDPNEAEYGREGDNIVRILCTWVVSARLVRLDSSLYVYVCMYAHM